MIPLLPGSWWEVALTGLPGYNVWLTGDAPLGSGAGRGAASGAGAGKARRATDAQRGPSSPS